MGKVTFRQENEVTVYHDVSGSMLNAIYRDAHGIIYTEYANTMTITFMDVGEFAQTVHILQRVLGEMLAEAGRENNKEFPDGKN